MAGFADHEGLASPLGHDLHPFGLGLPGPDGEVGERTDLVHAHLVRLPAEFASSRQEPTDQLLGAGGGSGWFTIFEDRVPLPYGWDTTERPDRRFAVLTAVDADLKAGARPVRSLDRGLVLGVDAPVGQQIQLRVEQLSIQLIARQASPAAFTEWIGKSFSATTRLPRSNDFGVNGPPEPLPLCRRRRTQSRSAASAGRRSRAEVPTGQNPPDQARWSSCGRSAHHPAGARASRRQRSQRTLSAGRDRPRRPPSRACRSAPGRAASHACAPPEPTP
jgi:hypothetical protein